MTVTAILYYRKIIDYHFWVFLQIGLEFFIRISKYSKIEYLKTIMNTLKKKKKHVLLLVVRQIFVCTNYKLYQTKLNSQPLLQCDGISLLQCNHNIALLQHIARQ